MKKAEIALTGLASIFYAGCSAVPSRIVEDVKLRKSPPMYSYSNSIDYRNVKELDKKFVKHNHPEKVDLQVLVDSEFIELYNFYKEDEAGISGTFNLCRWWTHFSQKMDSIDKRFNEKAGIDFEVDSVEYVKPPGYIPNDLSCMMSWIRLHYTPEQFDVFLLLTGKEVPESEGLCMPLGNHAVIAPRKYPYFLERIVQHELSHLFGARDARNSDDIMSNSFLNWSYKWSKKDASIMEGNKGRVWYYHDDYIHRIKKWISEFPEEEQDRVVELFCLASGSKFHYPGMQLAESFIKKYPDNKLINSCYQWLLDNKKNQWLLDNRTRLLREMIDQWMRTDFPYTKKE